MGPHEYLGCRSEQNGTVYTQKGGFIDMGHLRDCADWSAYLYQLIISKKGIDNFSIKLGKEGGTKSLHLNLPSDLSDQTAREIAGKIAYELSLWHEISTWYGASYVPFVPERYSSFSPEDMYSNLMGVTLAMKAIKSDLEYNEAMTILIANTLDSLGCVESSYDTFMAMEKVENHWWTRTKRLPSKNVLLKRYIDNDSVLIPWRLREDEISLNAYPLKKQSEKLNDYYELKIRLNSKFPVKRKFSPALGKEISQTDFDLIKGFIAEDVDKLNRKVERCSQRKLKRSEKKLTRKLKFKSQSKSYDNFLKNNLANRTKIKS